MNSATVPPDARRSKLVSYEDIDTRLVARADRAVREGARPSVMTGQEALDALQRCMDRQAVREGDPAAVRRAVAQSGIPVVEDVYSINGRQVVITAPEPTWYAVQTAPGMERRASADLAKLGHTARVPLREVWRKVGRRTDKQGKAVKVRAEVPLCTGYVFLGVVIPRPDWRIIRGREGVIDVVGIANAPVPIRDTDLLQAIFDADAAGAFKIPEPSTWAAEAGAVVRIADGPFAGFIARIAAAKGDVVKLIIDGLFGGAKIDVKKDALEPV